MNTLYKTLTIALLLALTSCGLIRPKYAYSYEMLTENSDSPTLTYTDSAISIYFSIEQKNIYFSLINNGPEPIKVIWDETVIIRDNIPEPIVNSSVSFDVKHLPQIPTVIPPGRSIVNTITPKHNIYWDSDIEENGYDDGKWKVYDLFPVHDWGSKSKKDAIYNSVGQTFSVYMPMVIGNDKKPYEFTFKIADVYKREY